MTKLESSVEPIAEPGPPDASEPAGLAFWRRHAAWLGFVIVLLAAVGYFTVAVRIPSLRDTPWLNLTLVAAGVVLSLHGCFRMFRTSARWGSKILAAGFTTGALALAGLFAAYIFVISYQVPPPTANTLQLASLPDFELIDQHGKKISRQDFEGKKLLVTFYRGYW